MGKIRLLVIEDNRLLREGVAAMFSNVPDIDVVAALASAEVLLESKERYRPDVILLDPGLAGQNTMRLVESVIEKLPATKVIITDLVPAHADMLGYVMAGASGFLLKDATLEDFLRTIRAVDRGMTELPSMLTGSLFTQIMETSMNGSKKEGSKLIDSVSITKREREVILLIAEALTNKEIAQRLHLSTATIKSHVHTILEKLTLHTRVHIAQYARTHQGFASPLESIPPPRRTSRSSQLFGR